MMYSTAAPRIGRTTEGPVKRRRRRPKRQGIIASRRKG